MAVVYQSDDLWATGLRDGVAAAIGLEPALELTLSVGIVTTEDATLGAAQLKQSGLRCDCSCAHP